MATDPIVEAYAAYTHQFGYAPQQPKHLIAFAKKSGVNVSWSVAKKLIQSKPDISGYVAPSNDDTAEKKTADKTDDNKEKLEINEVAQVDTRKYSKKFTGDQRVSMELVPKEEEPADGGHKKRDSFCDAVEQLIALGWIREQAVKALQQYEGNVLLANEWLMGAQTGDDVPSQSLSPRSPNCNSPSYSQQSQPMQSSSPKGRGVTWKSLMDGKKGSTEDRVKALQDLQDHVGEVDVSKDNGKVILGVVSMQIIDEDYIHRQHQVRRVAITTMPVVWAHCLEKVNNTVQLVEESFPGVLDSLYKVLDDNRAKPFHGVARECAEQVIGEVTSKPRDVGTIAALCGVLSEKTNLENVNQAKMRLFAAQQIFECVVFKNDSEIIHDLFCLDLDDHHNGMDRFVHGVELYDGDLPQNREWLDLIVATKWKSNDEETLKDIIADSVGLMLVDPNPDLAAVGFNLVVILKTMNDDFERNLEPEATRRFQKHFVGAAGPEVSGVMAMSGDGKSSNDESNGRDANGSVTRRIDALRESRPHSKVWLISQETDISVSAPSMPDI